MFIATLESDAFVASFISPVSVSESKLKSYYKEIPDSKFTQVQIAELPVLQENEDGMNTKGEVITHEFGTPVLEMAFNSSELEQAVALHEDGRVFGLEFNAGNVSGRTPRIVTLAE